MDLPLAPESPHEALVRAVGVVGSQSATGRLLKVSQGAVWRWLKEELPLPAEHVLIVERATGVSRHRLRPDLYPVDEPAHSPDLAQVNFHSPNDRAAGLQLGAAVR